MMKAVVYETDKHGNQIQTCSMSTVGGIVRLSSMSNSGAMILSSRLAGDNGFTVGPEDGDEFLKLLPSAYSGTRLRVGLEVDGVKGDLPGHPFRGNQWSGGSGEGKSAPVLGTPEEQDERWGYAGSDFRFQPDPEKRAVAAWQYDMPGQKNIRSIVKNIDEGKDPLDGVELEPRYVKKYTREAGENPKEYTVDDLKTDLVASARHLMKAESSPIETAYRGMNVQEAESIFSVGSSVPLGYRSATPDKNESMLYTKGEGTRVLMTIKNAKAIDLSTHASGKMKLSKEVVMRGNGKITHSEMKEGILHVTVESD